MAKTKTRNRQKMESFKGKYIIPIMGPTGAGKSTFINLVLGAHTVEVGHSLSSCTVDLEPVEVPTNLVHQNLPHWASATSKAEKTLIIVDTPGFDDTSADDSEILERIASWLSDTYGVKAKLAGVIYLQDICQRRVTGATKRNFEVFDKLCGKDSCKSVVLGTTQWTRVPTEERSMAASREGELQAVFWTDMIAKGSTTRRVDDGATGASPWDLVRIVLDKGQSPVLRIQQELADMKRDLPDTEAAAVLRRRIEELIQALKNAGGKKEDIRALERDVKALKKSFLARVFGGFFK